ncbi:MAG: hypothetical protein IJI50_09220 [Ruminococcus sp.]|nr:hypothetical protein [Ruminococcus sp.]
MTNTKFRKRALLSSVAMLLVALVALGSATFAWFAANPNASAFGLKLKTTAADGLVIRTETMSKWDHNVYLNAEQYTPEGETEPVWRSKLTAFDLQPASQSQTATSAATFKKVAAGASNAYDAKKGESVGTATVGYNGTKDVYAEKVYFRLSDGAASTTKKVYLTGVTIRANGSATMQNGIRVSVANKAGTLLYTGAIATGGAHKTLKDSVTTVDSTNGITDFDLAEFDPALATSVASNIEVTGLGALTSNADDLLNYVTVYVWLDGQDTIVASDNVGTVNAAAIIDSIQVDFTLA